jgi:SGNH domain (fused to AT3 domains)
VSTINALRPKAVFAVGLQDRGQVTMERTRPAAVAATIEGFAQEIRLSRARVLVPQNTPWFFGVGSPLQCLVANPSNVRRCNRDARKAVVESAMLHGIELAASAHLVVDVPVDALFCSSTICPVLVGNRIVYADDHHFSSVWAEHIVRAFASIFDPIV